ncbi:hypothetical protein HMPREF9554_01713, partial [Treponema phagedenis F0421]
MVPRRSDVLKQDCYKALTRRGLIFAYGKFTHPCSIPNDVLPDTPA